MTRIQRRAQLIGIGRQLFAAHGYDAVSIEEIASAAEVSKPVIYEHFGGKEGLYQVIVDRETEALNELLANSLDPSLPPRQALEGTVVALLDYIGENPDGFGLMVHQSPAVLAGGEFSTIISDMGEHLSILLAAHLSHLKFENESIQLYAQMLSGLMGIMGQWWAANKKPSKEIMATHLVNMMWNGLRGIERDPKIETL